MAVLPRKFNCSKVIKICLYLIATCVLVLTVHNFTLDIQYVYTHANVSAACVIPDLNPFDKEIMKHVFLPEPLTCSKDIDLVYFTWDGVLTINKTAAQHLSTVQCSYQIVSRQGDDEIALSDPISFTMPVYIPADLCYVTCSVNRKIVWERYLNNIDFKSVLSKGNILNESETQLSVLVFGIDSTSRLAAIRHLPKTMDFLQKTLGADIFKGHTVIGENTFANMIPFLTGTFAYGSNHLNMSYETDTFDNAPIIWKDFQNKGYVTYYAEDFPRFHLFNYNGKGFKDKPVDHYMRPFYLALEKQNHIKSYLEIVHMKAEALKIKLSSNSIFCYQNKARHLVMLDNLKHYFHSYTGKRRFALGYLVEVSHEVPSFLSIIDDDMYKFFKWLHDNHHLDNTIVFFIGDHGPRISSVRNTVVGRIEVIMPLLSLYIPKHLKQQYPALALNIKANTNILTTHTDSYKTLLDIVNRNFNTSNDLVFDSSNSMGTSFFKKINPFRTCANIKIPEYVCPCYTSQEMNKSDPLVYKTALFIVRSINDNLVQFKNICQKFSLGKIKYAEEISSGVQKTRVQNFRLQYYFSSKESICRRLRILLSVNVEEALFEAMVDVCGTDFKLVGKITRNNKYGEQSKCINVIDLKPLCICK